MWLSFELKFRFLRASSCIKLPTSTECAEHDFGHDLSTYSTFSRIISQSLSACAPTVSLSPVHAKDSANIPPRVIRASMLRLPQKSSCTISTLPLNTSPSESVLSPSFSIISPPAYLRLLASSAPSSSGSSVSAIPSKSGADLISAKFSNIFNPPLFLQQYFCLNSTIIDLSGQENKALTRRNFYEAQNNTY